MSRSQQTKKSSGRKPEKSTASKRPAQTGGDDEITQVSFRGLTLLLDDMQYQLSVLTVENETTAKQVKKISSQITALMDTLDCQDNMTFPTGG